MHFFSVRSSVSFREPRNMLQTSQGLNRQWTRIQAKILYGRVWASIRGGTSWSDAAPSIATRKNSYLCMVARLLSPHPDPLPQGEGTATPDSRKLPPRPLGRRPGEDSPSPKGEGRGEGRQTLRSSHGVSKLFCSGTGQV